MVSALERADALVGSSRWRGVRQRLSVSILRQHDIRVQEFLEPLRNPSSLIQAPVN